MALLAAAGMVVVTATVGWLAVRGRAHRPAVVGADVLATVGLTLLTIPAQTTAQQHGGMVTLTTIWAAGPTIEAAFLAGPLGGMVVAVIQFAGSAYVADTWQGRNLYSGVLLLVTGTVVGFVARLATRAEQELRVAAGGAGRGRRTRTAGPLDPRRRAAGARSGHRAGQRRGRAVDRDRRRGGRAGGGAPRADHFPPRAAPAAGASDLAEGLRALRRTG